jgi:N-carbamoylputrescine amidase
MACADDPAVNVERAAAHIAEAADGGARIVALPELFAGRYFCQSENPACFDAAEPLGGPIQARMAAVARACGVVVLVPFFERRAPGLYHNSCAVMDDQGHRIGLYRKMHIPDDPGFYEKFYFTPGDLGYQAFDTPWMRIGTLICWDQWYPEAARLTAMQGAALLFYPTAIGWAPSEKAAHGAAQHDAWRTVQRGHAIANGVYVAAVNRVGFEPAPTGQDGIEFWGQSFICDPQGVVLAEASVDREEILMADIAIEQLEEVRRIWPFWRDRRIESYPALLKRWGDPDV